MTNLYLILSARRLGIDEEFEDEVKAWLIEQMPLEVMRQKIYGLFYI